MTKGIAVDNRNMGYKSYWVAYFDLLGFENRVKIGRAVWPILEEYHAALTEIRTNPDIIRSKWFSDTFLFYTPDDSPTSFGGIEAACESFFYRMIERYIPVRGCLTVGHFYVEDDVLVGPALIDAYRLAECQDWLGFVLSPDAVSRRKQYGIRRDSYREYHVPVDHSRSTRTLETFIMSHRFPQCCSPDEWWRWLDDMEHMASTWIKLGKRHGGKRQNDNISTQNHAEDILRKYRNSKTYLRSLYPQLADFVQGEYGPILRNERRKARKLSWHLK
jgi:hypothetical protein